MPHRSGLVLCAATLLCAMGASAQTAPSPARPPAPVGQVTVVAKPAPKVIQQQARSFVQDYAATANAEVGQIGRWRDAVCVTVVGLPRADQAQAIKARIESVAQAVGLPAARSGCRPNVEIVFSDQPQQTMDLVAKKREYLLGYAHRNRHDRLKTVTRPVQAWYVTSTQADGADLGGLAWTAAAAFVRNHYADEVIDDPANQPPAGCGDNPRFSACLKSVFSNVFIVADSRVLQGRQLGEAADYLVMLALSQPRSLDGCTAARSVIDLFATPACPGREPPDGLTPADAAYLTALYAAEMDAKKWVQQSDIAGRMARILTRADAGG